VSAADITAIVAAAIALLATVLVPWYLRRRGRSESADRNQIVSWQGLNASLKQDVDSLRAERDRDRAERDRDREDYKRRLRELEEESDRQLSSARGRIVHLEDEVDRLSRRLASMQMRPFPQDPPGDPNGG
jgi:chromosome segregation ATPase